MRAKRWLLAGVALALLSAWLALPVPIEAAKTCWGGAPGQGAICLGQSTDAIPKGYVIFERGTERYYYWVGQGCPYRGLLIFSHHDTVESGLTQRQIDSGEVSLLDSMGIPVLAAPHNVLNEDCQ